MAIDKGEKTQKKPRQSCRGPTYHKISITSTKAKILSLFRLIDKPNNN